MERIDFHLSKRLHSVSVYCRRRITLDTNTRVTWISSPFSRFRPEGEEEGEKTERHPESLPSTKVPPWTIYSPLQLLPSSPPTGTLSGNDSLFLREGEKQGER